MRVEISKDAYIYCDDYQPPAFRDVQIIRNTDLSREFLIVKSNEVAALIDALKKASGQT